MKGDSMRRIDDESANTMTYEVMVRWQFETERPKYDVLGLDPENPKERVLADAVTYAIRAGQQFSQQNIGSTPFVRLSTMIAFGIVTPSELIELYNRLKNRTKSANG